MKVISIRVDEKIKKKMDEYSDINWSEVVRRAIESKVETEKYLRGQIDKARALEAAEDMDRLRLKTSGKWSGIEEIRKWRELRR